MSKEQAEELAVKIRTQLPLHYVTTMQSTDMRNAPRNYFVAVARSVDAEDTLIIHSSYEWDQALLAWEIIKD